MDGERTRSRPPRQTAAWLCESPMSPSSIGARCGTGGLDRSEGAALPRSIPKWPPGTGLVPLGAAWSAVGGPTGVSGDRHGGDL